MTAGRSFLGDPGILIGHLRPANTPSRHGPWIRLATSSPPWMTLRSPTRKPTGRAMGRSPDRFESAEDVLSIFRGYYENHNHNTGHQRARVAGACSILTS